MKTKSSYVSALSPEYALLGLLYFKPAHGYELHQRLDSDLGQIWHISLSQTYNILKRLKARGYVKETIQEQSKLPDRRQFHLTEAGCERFNDWFRSPTGSSVRAIRVEFTTRLYFARMIDPPMVDRLIDEQIAETGAGLKRLETVLADIPPGQAFNRLGLELRVRQLASILDWLGECRIALVQSEKE